MLPQSYNNYQPSQHFVRYQPYQVYNRVNYRQKQVDNIPGPNFEILDPNLLNVSKSVCKIRIDTNQGSFGGSGFFLKFLINGKFYYWLVTNEHVITKEMINNKYIVNVSYNIESKNINIKLDQNERYIKTFKEYKVDATIIKIMPEDNVHEDYFLEPELGYDNNNLVGKEIFIPQFPSFQPIKNAKGIISKINIYIPNEFTHLAKTQKGSSGSPIFLKGNKKVIGIHKEGNPIMQENYGDFISPIVSILTNDIMNLFKGMQINQISNNTFFNLQQSYGQINPNPNGISNFLVGPLYNNNNNQIKAVNPNMINNNKVNIIGISNNNYQNNPDERYVGQLVNGLRHGKGTVYYKNNGKMKYEGDFKNDKYEGYGELYDEEGTIKYKGFF